MAKKKKGSTGSSKAERERALKALQPKADKIKSSDDAIKKNQRLCTTEAIKAGEHLASAKAELKLSRAMAFKRWIEEICEIAYRTANNYMRIADAAKEDPAIRQMGLTEAYVHLGLVTRKSPTSDAPNGEGTGGEGGHQTDDISVSRRIANIELLRERDFFVLEVEEQHCLDTLQAVIADRDNLVEVLKEGGLLIKLTTSASPSDGNEVINDDDVADDTGEGAGEGDDGGEEDGNAASA